MGKNIGKYISKILSSKHSQTLLDHGKQSGTDAAKASSKWVIQKTAEAIDDLIGTKIANKITNVSKKAKTVTNEHDKEIPKERYVSLEERQKIIDELRLK